MPEEIQDLQNLTFPAATEYVGHYFSGADGRTDIRLNKRFKSSEFWAGVDLRDLRLVLEHVRSAIYDKERERG